MWKPKLIRVFVLSVVFFFLTQPYQENKENTFLFLNVGCVCCIFPLIWRSMDKTHIHDPAVKNSNNFVSPMLLTPPWAVRAAEDARLTSCNLRTCSSHKTGYLTVKFMVALKQVDGWNKSCMRHLHVPSLENRVGGSSGTPPSWCGCWW